MNVADLQIWVEFRPDLRTKTMRVCWVSRKALHVKIYSKFTSQACENALTRQWPQFWKVTWHTPQQARDAVRVELQQEVTS